MKMNTNIDVKLPNNFIGEEEFFIDLNNYNGLTEIVSLISDAQTYIDKEVNDSEQLDTLDIKELDRLFEAAQLLITTNNNIHNITKGIIELKNILNNDKSVISLIDDSDISDLVEKMEYIVKDLRVYLL